LGEEGPAAAGSMTFRSENQKETTDPTKLVDQDDHHHRRMEHQNHLKSREDGTNCSWDAQLYFYVAWTEMAASWLSETGNWRTLLHSDHNDEDVAHTEDVTIMMLKEAERVLGECEALDPRMITASFRT
jgi:hypothetical protein